MSFLAKVQASTLPDNFGARMAEAMEILEEDRNYQYLLTALRSNASKYFNSSAKQPDAHVKEGETKEAELVKKLEQREKELNIRHAPNGMYYYAGTMKQLNG